MDTLYAPGPRKKPSQRFILCSAPAAGVRSAAITLRWRSSVMSGETPEGAADAITELLDLHTNLTIDMGIAICAHDMEACSALKAQRAGDVLVRGDAGSW